jgi:hypothetical protein
VAHLGPHLVRRAERQHLLRVDAPAPEHHVPAVGRLEAGRVHAARRDLHRVDDVHADVDQVRDEVEHRAAAV